MALSLLDKAKQYFTSKSQDNEGWFRQGKFTPVKQLTNIGYNIATKTVPTVLNTVKNDVYSFGEGLGKAATAPFEANRLMDTAKLNTQISQQNIQKAIQLKNQGNIEGYKKLLAFNNQPTQNTNDINRFLVENEKNKNQTLVGAAKTAGYLPSVWGGGVGQYAVGGLLGAVASKLQGQDPYVGAGKAIADVKRANLVTQFTSPLTRSFLGEISKGTAGPIAKGLYSRMVGGFGNVIEDEMISNLEKQNRGILDRALSFGIGFVASGPKQSGDLRLKDFNKMLRDEWDRSLNQSGYAGMPQREKELLFKIVQTGADMYDKATPAFKKAFDFSQYPTNKATPEEIDWLAKFDKKYTGTYEGHGEASPTVAEINKAKEIASKINYEDIKQPGLSIRPIKPSERLKNQSQPIKTGEITKEIVDENYRKATRQLQDAEDLYERVANPNSPEYDEKSIKRASELVNNFEYGLKKAKTELEKFYKPSPIKTGEINTKGVGGEEVYRWFNNDKKIFVEVKDAKPVSIEGLDTFVHRGRDGKGWQVTENKSGSLVSDGTFKTQQEAINSATKRLQAFKKAGNDINSQIKKLQEYSEASQHPASYASEAEYNRLNFRKNETSVSPFKGVGGEIKQPTIKIKTNPTIKSSAQTLPGTPTIKVSSPQDVLLQPGKLPQPESGKIKLKTPLIQKSQTPLPLSSDKIIQEAKQEIGSNQQAPKQSVGQWWDKVYTDWVDRYHPIDKIASQAKDIPSKDNPIYTIKRFLGSSGIAESRFQNELKPIIKQIDDLKIDKSDLDVYLKARRDINLSERGIKGSDSNLATQRITALEQRYGDNIKQIAQQLYDYQSKGFSELAKDFLGKDVAKLVKQKNVDYVPFQRVMDEVDDFIGTGVKLQQGTQPIIKIKGSNKQIYSPLESVILNTYKQRAAIEKNNVAKSIVSLQDYLPSIGFKRVSKSGGDTISVWRDGKKEFWSVGQDIAESVKGMNEEQMNTFLKVLSAPARILRQGATGRNLDFMIPNVIRDQLDAAVGSKYGYIPVVDYVRGFAHLLKQDLGGGDNIYKQWMESGGAQSFGSISGRETAKEFLSGKTTKNPIKLLGGWLTGGLDTLGRYSETPTRLGLFQRALDKTGDPMKAAFESREGTLDFARMGAKMKVANSLIPFLNVGVQGLDKMVRTFKANPAGFIAKMGIYGAVPTITVSAYNHIYHPQEYAEIPQYEKDGNFVIIQGRNEDGTINYFKIPKGNMIEMISNPLESLISHAMGTNDQTVKQTLLSFISQSLPIIGDGSSLKEIGIKTIGENLPQAVKPITENLLNKSFFKYNAKNQEASEVVPSYLKKKAPAEQAYKFTEESYKVIGRVLNTSPLQVKNLMEGYLAGYVKMPLNIIETLNKAKNGEAIDKNKIPIIRRFMSQTYQSNGKQITKETPKSEKVKSANAAEGSVIGKEFTYKDTAGKNQKIIVEEIPEYKSSGQKELDKNQVSSYNSKIQTEIGNIRKLYQLGKIGADEAEKLIKEYQGKKISTKKKSNKSKGGKITIAKVTTPTIKKFKLPTIKLPNTSLKSNIKVKKPSIAQLKKRRTIKIKV